MSATQSTDSRGPRRRIWVQQVAVETNKLQMRVDAARARGDLAESQEIIAVGIDGFIQKARAAAFRDDPVPGRVANWWRGTLVEAAYRNMHTARAALFDLYTYDELQAEVPMVVARANATLHRDDPRRMTVAELRAEPVDGLRPRLRRMVGDSYEQLDLEHAQLRSFRNIVLMATLLLVIAVASTLVFITRYPDWMPLCFESTGTSVSCPTTSGASATPTWPDILIVTGIGALGGVFAATLSIRNLSGTSTPYDVPVALATLKVPLGALTALLGLVAIKGGFAPGLSNLDSQGQILAYALLFGFSQQALSRLLDRRAQDLLEGLPGGEAVAPLPGTKGEPVPPVPPVGGPPAGAGSGEGAAGVGEGAAGVGAAPEGAASPTPGGAAVGTSSDRNVDEPEGATQQDQLDALRDTGNARRDMTEDEEADLLTAEFGAPDANGIYGAHAVDGGDAGQPDPGAGGRS